MKNSFTITRRAALGVLAGAVLLAGAASVLARKVKGLSAKKAAAAAEEKKEAGPPVKPEGRPASDAALPGTPVRVEIYDEVADLARVSTLTLQEIAALAMDLQGPSGVLSEGSQSTAGARFQAMLLRSPATRIEGGTDEILRNIIAERVLGLPADMRADRGMPFNQIPTRVR